VVGSVTLATVPFRSGSIEWTIDRLLPDDQRLSIAAELLDIGLEWMLREKNLKWASVSLPDDATAPLEAIRAAGGREAYRLRQFVRFGDRRLDQVTWQFFNPVWVDHLGDPQFVAAPGDRSGKLARHTPVIARSDSAPREAIALGERLYLRAVDPAESEFVAESWMVEPEHFSPRGRELGNPYTWGHVHTTVARAELPEWIRLAVALRSSGELIGITGLRAIDWINRTAETQTGIFHAEHRGRGFGFELKQLLLDYAFNRLGMHMVWALVNEGNDRSAAALGRQGYRQAGYLAWTTLNNTGMGGDWLFDLLASEWRNARNHALDQKDAGAK
jgi:RimJ/RimL family protein N-acetyltransferase